MKSVSLLFASILLFSSILLANIRGITERMIGEGFLQRTQSITLDKKIEDISGDKVDSIILTTPVRTGDNDRLLLDGKRSIVLIDSSNIEDIEDGLRKSIEAVVSNKSAALNTRGFNYETTGIDNFYVIGNFEASRTAGGDHEWFVAIIPKPEKHPKVKVEKVVFQTEWFGTGAGAHNQVRMILNKPVVVIPQLDQVHTPMILDYYQENQGDIVYTLQAARVKGGEQDWQPLSGVMGEFGNALQFFDTRTLMIDQISRSVIDEHTLDNLDQSSKNAILNAAVLQADEGGETMGIYNTVFASCVTYALKALKAGIPAIDTTWFNPYSIVQKVSAAHGKGTTYIGSSMNDIYGPYLGGQEMTRSKLEDKESFKAIHAIRKPILEQDAFDDIVRKLALFINKENITYDQVKAFMVKVNEPGAVLSDIKMETAKGKALLSKINELWKANFAAEYGLETFFQALQGLQTQETTDLESQQ